MTESSKRLYDKLKKEDEHDVQNNRFIKEAQEDIDKADMLKKEEDRIEKIAKDYSNNEGTSSEISEVVDFVPNIFDSKSSPEILSKHIAQTWIVRFNTMTSLLEVGGQMMSDEVLSTIAYDLWSKGRKTSMADVQLLLSGLDIPRFNPFMDVVNKYTYDQCVGEIEKWCSGINAVQPDAYVWLFFTKWIVGMAATASGETEEPNSLMLCLVSAKKNIGKTYNLRRVLPPSLRKYTSENFPEDLHSKEFMAAIQTNILMINDELDSLSKKDFTTYKMLLSKEKAEYTAKYKMFETKVKRLTTFAGTGNNIGIIKEYDNRRIIPIEVNSMDFEILNSVDKEKMIAEAYYLFKEKGFDFNLNQEEIEELAKHTKQHLASDPVSDAISRLYDIPEKEGLGVWLMLFELQVDIKRLIGYHPNDTRLGTAMGNFSFEKSRKRMGGNKNPSVVYCVIRKPII